MTGIEKAAAWRDEGHYLEPCPFCGSNGAPELLCRSEVADDYDKELSDGYFAVVCAVTTSSGGWSGCGGASGYHRSPQKAADAWNKRRERNGD